MKANIGCLHISLSNDRRQKGQTFTGYIQGVAKETDPCKEAARGLEGLQLMRNGVFPLFVDPFYEIYVKSETVDGALDFLNKLRRKRAAPVKTYFAMLDVLCKAGKHMEAQDLLYQCPHHG